MDRASVSIQVRQIISDITRWPLEQVTEDARFKEDLSTDSFEMTDIATVVEREFNIAIGDDSLEACLTVGQLVDLVAT